MQEVYALCETQDHINASAKTDSRAEKQLL